MTLIQENGSNAPALTLDRTMPTSLFAEARERVYKNRYAVGLLVPHLVGGVPTDPNKIEGWLRSKIEAKDDIIRDMVAEAVVDRGLAGEDTDPEKAIADVVANKHLNGFKRLDGIKSLHEYGTLYIEGRQVKAMIKEAANIRWPDKRWGPTRKGTKAFTAEHLFVLEDVISLGVTAPTDIQQRFVQSRFGSSITLEEYLEDADVRFTLVTDHDFTQEEFEDLFVTAEMNGLGASRSQGYGRHVVTQFDKIKA